MPQAGEEQSENAGQPWSRIHFPRVRGPSQSNSKFAGASRGFFSLSLSLSLLCTVRPPPTPRGEALAASLHPLSKRSAETVAGAPLEVPAELPSPQLPLACASLPRSPLPPRPPALKVQTRPKATAGAGLSGHRTRLASHWSWIQHPGGGQLLIGELGARRRPRPGPPGSLL